jgi:hypothetical protein
MVATVARPAPATQKPEKAAFLQFTDHFAPLAEDGF